MLPCEAGESGGGVLELVPELALTFRSLGTGVADAKGTALVVKNGAESALRRGKPSPGGGRIFFTAGRLPSCVGSLMMGFGADVVVLAEKDDDKP